MRLLALFLLVSTSQAATLAQRVEKVLSHPAARRAFWGVKVVDLDSGETLYQLNADRLFTPASNAKLFSTSLALVRLGPDHRFLTRLAAEAPPDDEGRIAGDLALIGGGDPNLSSRVLPFEKQTQFAGDRLAPIEDLADEVVAAGVSRIDGDIVGDDTFYVWQRYPQGWSVEDTVNRDGAPVTALALNDNTVMLVVRPGAKAGDPAAVRFEPPNGYFGIDNHVRTTSAKGGRPIRVDRKPGEQTVRLWGEIGLADAGFSEVLAIDDPALFAAQALREALLRRSVGVLGQAASRHTFPWERDLSRKPFAWTLASRSSMPLVEDLRVTNKVSQNLHAELALRAAARVRRGEGSVEASLAELQGFLQEAGIGAQEVSLRDGSGLSRMDLVSPAAVVSLLAYMWKSDLRERWLEALPVAGVDGTLRHRFQQSAATGRVHAKTGSLSNVAALSGYLETPAGGHLGFSVLVNHYIGEASQIRLLIDRLCAELQ